MDSLLEDADWVWTPPLIRRSGRPNHRPAPEALPQSRESRHRQRPVVRVLQAETCHPMRREAMHERSVEISQAGTVKLMRCEVTRPASPLRKRRRLVLINWGAERMEASGFGLWHVAQSWQPPLRVRPLSGIAADRGPGVIACTNAQAARRLFKNAATTVRMELSATTRWLTSHSRQCVDRRVARAVVNEFFEGKARDAMLAGLAQQPDPVRIWTIVALAIVTRACAGSPGVALAQWLAAQRVDALVREVSPTENWVMIVQPACVRSAIRISNVSSTLPIFPPIDQQLAAGIGIAPSRVGADASSITPGCRRSACPVTEPASPAVLRAGSGCRAVRASRSRRWSPDRRRSDPAGRRPRGRPR